MNSKSETGHARNVANFEDLLTGLSGMGAAYNPVKAGIKLAAMQTQLIAAKAAMAAIDSAMPAYVAAVDARQTAFAPLSKIVTRVANMYKVSVAGKNEAETAISLQKKIQGSSRSGGAVVQAAIAEAPVKKKVSTSQQSYDMIIQHFEQLIKILSSNPAYAPNEADLKPAALNTLLADLKTKSAAVTAAEYPVVSGRITRDKLLYAPVTGIVALAADVKTYIKASFGAGSPQLEYVNRFTLRTVRQ